jgi:hypothetical protein
VPVRRPSAETLGCADFEASTPQPIPTLESVGTSPLGFGSPTQFHQLHTARSRRRARRLPRPCSVRGFFPYSVLPVARSHLAPAGTQPTGYVASTGFRTLSTLCSPRDLPGLFHPGSAPGVPLRGLSLHGAVRPLERRTPQVFGGAPASLASPSGIEHTMEILHTGLGFSQVTAPLPPWDWPLRGFLPTPAVDRVTSPPPLPRFSVQTAC